MSEEKEYKLTERLAPFVSFTIVAVVVLLLVFIIYKGAMFLAMGA